MIKQVLVWNKELKVRKGKFAAQIAHASIGALLKQAAVNYDEKYNQLFYRFREPATIEWLQTKFTKIVVGIENEEELLKLSQRLEDAKIEHVIIKDSGLTEFHGVPTITCLGIGPIDSEVIDPITGHLPLM